MEILNLILASATEAAISVKAEAGTLDSCTQPSASWVDFAIVAVICATVVGCVAIIALRIKEILTDNMARRNEQTAEIRAHELAKIEKENSRKEAKDRHDAAWRFIEHYWKTVPELLTEDDRQRYREAWSYIKSRWTELPEPTEKEDGGLSQP